MSSTQCGIELNVRPTLHYNRYGLGSIPSHFCVFVPTSGITRYTHTKLSENVMIDRVSTRLFKCRYFSGHSGTSCQAGGFCSTGEVFFCIFWCVLPGSRIIWYLLGASCVGIYPAGYILCPAKHVDKPQQVCIPSGLHGDTETRSCRLIA